MSRCSGLRLFTRLPAMTTSPLVARSSPAIMRSVVVLPQPEGPRRHTTSPAATDRATLCTAVKLPKRLVTCLSSIVAIRSCLTFDGAKGDTTQKLILQCEGHYDDRDQKQRLDRRQKSPADANV